MKVQSTGATGLVVGLTANLRAPRREVFEAWTSPERIAQWFFAEAGYRTHDVRMDLSPRGAYQIVVSSEGDDDPTRIVGHFIDVVPDESLAYTWTGTCAEEQYWTLVTVRFVDDPDGGSRLELVHGVFRTEVDRVLHEQGWLSCLTALGNLLEAT